MGRFKIFNIEEKFFTYQGSQITGLEYTIDKLKDSILLDKKTGKVILFGKNLDIKYDTRSYKFIEILYENQGEYIEGEKIIDHLGTIQSERKKVLGDVSSRLPEEIKSIIEVSNGNYRLLNDTEILRGIYG